LIPLLLISLTVLFCASTVSAADETLYVNGSYGNDSWDGQTWQTAKLTIQNATGTVSSNGVVTIADGVYSGTGNTNITINRNMTIQGLSQEGTIINGTDTNWIFNIASGVNVTICNLTFTNGIAYDGGAILNHGILSISDCTFTENTATHWGGAIYSNGYGSVMSLTDCTFTKNNALDGGGAIAYLNTCNVTNCTFLYNSVTGANSWCGGAIGAYSLSSSTVTGCTFVGNSVDPIPSSFGGGAIYVYNAALTANFNRFYNNSARLGSAFAFNKVITGVINAENNWWGSNVDPTTVPNLIYGSVDANPWVILTINATPDVLCVGETSTFTANLNYNNLGEDLMATYGKSIPSVEAQFTVDNLGTLNTYNGNITNGENLTTTFTAGQMPGNSTVNVTVGNFTVTKKITIQREDVYVATAADGGSDSNNGNSNSPFLTLEKALDAVMANGRIHIANGQYTGTSNMNLHVQRNVTILRDTWISGVGDTVIINAENKDCIIYNGYTLVLQNLVLVNGNNSGNWGYGGAIQNDGNLTVENCTFTGNIANYGGAIANLYYASIWARYDGSYSISWEFTNTVSSTIIGSTFTGNTAIYDGGAISNYIYAVTNVTAYNGANITAAITGFITSNITNCTFTYNTAYNGGAIANNCTITAIATSENGNATAISNGNINSIITGCTLANNTATYGGAISDYCYLNLEATSTKAITSLVGTAIINDSITGCTLANNSATYGGVFSALCGFTFTRTWSEGPEPAMDYKIDLSPVLHFNRIIGNTATTGSAIWGYPSHAVNATYNWWGSNVNPSSQIFGLVDYSPWLFMTINANPETINNTQTSLITVSLNNYSPDGISSSPLDPNLGHIPDGVPVTFSLIDGPLGSLGSQTGFINGTASIIFTANTVGVQHVNATIDNENRTATITINPRGHVNITKTADNYTPNYWDVVTFTITAHNEGPDDVEGLEITDILPNGLTLISADTHGFGSYNSGIWNIGKLANGTTAILTLFVNATSTGTFTNWANVTAQTTYDPEPWSQDNTIITVASAADIAVEKAFYDYEGDYEITSGNYWDIISTRILVTNNGPDTATNVVISDILGSGLSFVDEWWVKWDINDWYWNWNDTSFDPATMTWTIPSLLAGQTAALDIMTNLTSTGTLHNYAELVSSETYDWNQTNNNDTAYLTVPEASYLSIYKEFRDLPWGNVITTAYYNDVIYAIVQVKNQGPDTTSVSILDTMTGIVWTGNYYVLSNVGSILPTPSSWVLNDPVNTFNGTNWNIPFLNTFIGSEKWLAIEGIINTTGINAASNHAETVDQNTYPYKGNASYTANLTTLVTPTSITVNSPSAYNGDTVTITATLTDTVHNTPVTNKPVTITVNGQTHNTNTDSSGQITWTYLISNMDAQKYTIAASFAGDSQYTASNANGTLTVNLISTSITVGDIRGNKGDTVTLSASLTDHNSDPVVGSTVEFWVDSVKVGESNTGSNGTAIFNYQITETPGNHTLKAVFTGNTFYQGTNTTGNLYVPSANLYIVITSNKNNPTVGETFTLTYKLGNNGPDTADNVTITIPLPEGFVISKIEGDGNWTVTGNTITWTMNNVTVGDPYLYISGWTTGPGNYLFTASIASDTFSINSRGVSPLTLNAQPTVTAATTTNTVGMQTTGAPVLPLALAVLGVLCGLVATWKKQ